MNSLIFLYTFDFRSFGRKIVENKVKSYSENTKCKKILITKNQRIY